MALVLYYATLDNLEKGSLFLYNISEEYNLEIATKKTEVSGFVGTDHPKIVINNETLEQFSQFTYSRLQYILPIFPNDVEFKLAKFFTINGYY